MNLTTTDLRDAMDAYADSVLAPDSEETLAAVQAKVAEDRGHRRSFLLAAVAAVTVLLAAIAGLNALGGRDAAPSPAEQVKKLGSQLPLFVDGYRLVTVKEVPVSNGDPQRFLNPAGEPTGLNFVDVAGGTTVPRRALVWCQDLMISGTAYEDTATLVTSAGRSARCSGGESQSYPGPAHEWVQADGPRGWQLAVVSANDQVRRRVPVGIYQPMKWGDQAASTQTASLPPLPDSSTVFGQTGQTATVTGQGPGSLTTTIVPKESGTTGVAIDVESSSTGQFAASVDGVNANPVDMTLATGKWSPVWTPGRGTSLIVVFEARAGHPVKIVTTAKDNRAAWRATVTLSPSTH